MKQLKPVVVLTGICAVVAALLAWTNGITAPIIEKNQNAVLQNSLEVVLPGGGDFETVDILNKNLPVTVKTVYRAANGGYVFNLVTSGYAPGLTILCGVDDSGAVAGAVCLASGETFGYEKTYGDSVKGATLDTVDELDTVSGATKTTTAYKQAVKDALASFAILQGKTVDLRTEEEILADNLNAALPAAQGAFTKLFLLDPLDGVSAVYTADNNTGTVYVYGEQFVAVNTEGTVISSVSDDVKQHIETQAATVNAFSKEEFPVTGELPPHILQLYKTTKGNYVFDLRASGFGIQGNDWYNPSGEYIYLTVSITRNGTIIDCRTTKQSETEGFGSQCAAPSFYEQFIGRNESNYNDVDAISGATITTNGYKTAIAKALETVRQLEGGEDQ